MKYIDYGEFKILREYKKQQGSITISGESDIPYRLVEMTGRRYSVRSFDRLICRCNYRKMRRINTAIKRSNRTLSILGHTPYASIRGQVFKTKLGDSKFKYIFEKHLRDTGWYNKHKKKR